MADTSIALLRGINVGGKNKLPMADLRALFRDVGCDAPKTYIQSGNVLFRADEALAARLPEAVPREIAARYGYEVPVVVRTLPAFRSAVARNPLAVEPREPHHLHYGFLSEVPTAEAVASLDPDRSPSDEFALVGDTLYLHCPNGVARTRLTNAYFDRVLGVVSTMRNHRTVTKLLELAREG